MKVLFFTQIFPSSREPTRGPYNRYAFRAMAAHCEARVVSPQPWWHRVRRPSEWLAPPQETIDGMPVTYPTYWAVPRWAPGTSGGAIARSVHSHIAHLRQEFPFDAVVAAWAYPDTEAAARIAAAYGCPLITRVLGSDINQLGQDPRLRPCVQQALRRCERVIAVSNALRDRMIDLGVEASRIVVQHNAVDGERFVLRDRAELRAQLGLPADRPILCYVGRLSREKGIDLLLDAMCHLKQQGCTDVLLTIVGRGAMEPELQAHVQAADLQTQVLFCGEQSHHEVPLWIGACDVLCLPSRREGCPNVVLEALASGRPVVAAEVGGVPELLSRGNGITVPPENPAALAAALTDALARAWDAQALRGSVEHLSWDDVGRRDFSLLTEVMREWESCRRTGLLQPAASR